MFFGEGELLFRNQVTLVGGELENQTVRRAWIPACEGMTMGCGRGVRVVDRGGKSEAEMARVVAQEETVVGLSARTIEHEVVDPAMTI